MGTRTSEPLRPPVGSEVVLTVTVEDAVLDIPCIVRQDVAEGELVILPCRSTFPLPVTEGIMSWAVPRGAAQQNVRVQPLPPDGWRVRLDGPARVVQRRRFARAYEEFPAQLEVASRLLPVVGRDISEGGLRCRLPKGVRAETGSKVRVRLQLGAVRVRADATVVRLVAVDDDCYEVGLAMSLSEREADQVRAGTCTPCSCARFGLADRTLPRGRPGMRD